MTRHEPDLDAIKRRRLRGEAGSYEVDVLVAEVERLRAELAEALQDSRVAVNLATELGQQMLAAEAEVKRLRTWDGALIRPAIPVVPDA